MRQSEKISKLFGLTNDESLIADYLPVGTEGPEGVSGASLITSSIMDIGAFPTPAIIARIIVVEKKPTAKMVVTLVSRFAVPRAVIKPPPAPPPPIPRPPPSLRCNKTVMTSPKGDQNMNG